jgi:hypothetical protein
MFGQGPELGRLPTNRRKTGRNQQKETATRQILVAVSAEAQTPLAGCHTSCSTKERHSSLARKLEHSKLAHSTSERSNGPSGERRNRSVACSKGCNKDHSSSGLAHSRSVQLEHSRSARKLERSRLARSRPERSNANDGGRRWRPKPKRIRKQQRSPGWAGHNGISWGGFLQQTRNMG